MQLQSIISPHHQSLDVSVKSHSGSPELHSSLKRRFSREYFKMEKFRGKGFVQPGQQKIARIFHAKLQLGRNDSNPAASANPVLFTSYDSLLAPITYGFTALC